MSLQATLPKISTIETKGFQSASPYIPVNSTQLQNYYLPKAYELRNSFQQPDIQRYSTRINSGLKLTPPSELERPDQKQTIERKTLQLHPEAPKPEEIKPDIELNPNEILTAIKTLKPNLDSEKKLEPQLKNLWKKKGKPQIIAARHTEFMVEPKVFIGEKLNPQIAQLLVEDYLSKGPRDNVEASPEKLVIKSPEGKAIAVVRDPQLIEQYLSQLA